MKMKKGKNVASLTCDTQIRAYKAAGWAEVKEKTKAKPDPDPAKTGGFDGVEK